ncbi:hypothetical protein [Neobacillus sp. LXY-1]|uniref:hypothetical protein n=1 Tax=Neobacillus sp. LXY-1 TaxID=3379133 RepID=UPI003EDFC036
MLGLLIAIIIFNIVAIKKNRLSTNQLVHIWMFTITSQSLFDLFVEFKYHGYWYFDKEIDFSGLLPHIILVPPVNTVFLSLFPFHKTFLHKMIYFICFYIFILLYELVTLLPSPWGYFHYGWWKLWHAAILDPILLLILLGYYKWICQIEKAATMQFEK